MMRVRDSERLMGAFLLAVLLHAGIFTAVHFIAPYVPEQRPAHLGPLTIVLPDHAIPLTVNRSTEPEAETPQPEPAAQVPVTQVPAVPAPQTTAAQAPRQSRQTAARDASRAQAAASSLAPPPAGATWGVDSSSAMNYLFPEEVSPDRSSSGIAGEPAAQVNRNTGTVGAAGASSRVVYDENPVPQEEPLTPSAGTGTTGTAVSGSSPAGTGAGQAGSGRQMSELDRTLAQRGQPGGSAGSVGAAASGGAPESGGAAASGGAAGSNVDILSLDELSGQRRKLSGDVPVIPERISLEGKPAVELVVRLVITPSGLVQSAVLENSSGYTELDEAVTAAFKRWRFAPLPTGETQTKEVRYKVTVRAR